MKIRVVKNSPKKDAKEKKTYRKRNLENYIKDTGSLCLYTSMCDTEQVSPYT